MFEVLELKMYIFQLTTYMGPELQNRFKETEIATEMRKDRDTEISVKF